jgi:hypothetical protein
VFLANEALTAGEWQPSLLTGVLAASESGLPSIPCGALLLEVGKLNEFSAKRLKGFAMASSVPISERDG